MVRESGVSKVVIVTWYVGDSDTVAGLSHPSSWQTGRGGGRTVVVQTAGIVAEINLLR